MIDSLEIAKRLLFIQDNGPIYNEFIYEADVHEPWNAYSSLFFFVPIIFWIWKLRGEYKNHLIIVALLPLLFLNGLGSTLFHAFRSNSLLFILDWLPASLMSIILGVYFWSKVVKKWWLGLLIVMGFYLISSLTLTALNDIQKFKSVAPNIAYSFVGLMFFIPILILLKRNKYKFVRYIILTFLFLTLALLFRALDYPTPNPFSWLPQGTHFLWHVFSSFAVFSLGFFIFKTNQQQN